MRLAPTVSLNGARSAADGPAVPMSPQDLAEAALASVAAGAGEVLVHPRTPCGRQSLSPRVVGPVLEALRGAGVGVPLCVDASIGAEPDPAGRLERVRSWSVLPDRAAVSFAEPGAGELAGALLARGVVVEAVVPLGGPAGPEPMARFLAWPVRDPGRVRLAGSSRRPIRPWWPLCAGRRRWRCCCTGGRPPPGRCCGWPRGAVRAGGPASGTYCTCRTGGRRGRMPNWSRRPGGVGAGGRDGS